MCLARAVETATDCSGAGSAEMELEMRQHGNLEKKENSLVLFLKLFLKFVRLA